MRASLMVVLLSFTGILHAAVTHVPIKSGVALAPGQAYTLTLETAKPLEIGWTAVQAKECKTNCVEATDLRGPIHYGVATALGASKVYQPDAGKISIEYKNISSEPVTINIYRIERTCEAEACRFLKTDEKGRWLVYKVAALKSITTSKDNSYSVITGITTSHRPFSVRAVWWSDDKNAFRFHCADWIKRYLDNHTPPEKYSPYILSGHAIGEGDSIVMKSIDTCVPNAPNYGVPDANVFK
jgi:hypothetical protein